MGTAWVRRRAFPRDLWHGAAPCASDGSFSRRCCCSCPCN
jgi:hypothetical protein